MAGERCKHVGICFELIDSRGNSVANHLLNEILRRTYNRLRFVFVWMEKAKFRVEFKLKPSTPTSQQQLPSRFLLISTGRVTLLHCLL